MNPYPIELIGCGALGEQVYAPVLAHLARAGRVQVVALVDPVAERRAQIAKIFPSAHSAARWEDLPPAPNALAVIASPPAFHAAQACALLAAGRHVLCEKPLALSVTEAEMMIAAANRAGRLLAAGMMRRFYPSFQALRENLSAGTFGEPQRLEVSEGGRYGWNAASPKFFEPANGGVLFDLGSHVLDLLCHCFGEPAATESWNDALGGTNTNCVLTARWANNLTARVRLSWDVANLPTGWRIQTTRGECRWNGLSDGALAFQPRASQWWLRATAHSAPPRADPATISSWTGAFVRQFDNVLGAIGGKNALLAPATDVLPSLRWLETARNQAKFLPQPWLSPPELARAAQFAQT